MKFQEKGVTYKASVRAFLGNYLIGMGLLFLAFLVVRKFDLAFTVFPQTLEEIVGTAVYVGFGGAAIYLFLEPFMEGTVRKYIVSNNEIVKIEGVVSKKRLAVPFQSVSEVRLSKGLLGRILNYGSIDVVTFGDSGGIKMGRMSNPEEVQRVVQHKVNLMRNIATKRTKSIDPEKEDNVEDLED